MLSAGKEKKLFSLFSVISSHFVRRNGQVLGFNNLDFAATFRWWEKNKFNFTCSYSRDDQGFFQQFWEKAPGQNWEKMIDLTSKLGEINDIEHNKDKIILKIKLF